MNNLNNGLIPRINVVGEPPQLTISMTEINNSVWPLFDENDSTLDYYLIEFDKPFALDLYDLALEIPDDVFCKIKDLNDPSYLLLSNTFEAYKVSVPAIYKYVILKHEIPPEKCILLTGAIDILPHVKSIAKQCNLGEIKVATIMVFEERVQNQLTNWINSDVPELNRLPPLDSIYDKKFLCLNREWRIQRPMLVASLLTRDLLKYGHVSLGKCFGRHGWPQVWDSMLVEISHNEELSTLLDGNREKIFNLGCLYLDTDDLVTNRELLEPSIVKYYNETYFSVTTETNYFNQPKMVDYDHPLVDYDHLMQTEDCIFFSEKIFKPIAHRHPFILVSTPGSLVELRKLGYRTFNPIIDETYDTIEDCAERMLAILKEIERLSLLSDIEVIDFRKETCDILNHNQQVLLTKKKFKHILNY